MSYHSATEYFYEGKKEIRALLEVEDGVSVVYLEVGAHLSSTLEYAKSFGGIGDDMTENWLPIKDSTLNDIEQWAIEEGY
jgi:hypothetical protein